MNCDCCAADLKGLAAYDDPETGKVLCAADARIVMGIRNGTIDPNDRATVRKYPVGRMTLVDLYLRGPMEPPKPDYAARARQQVKIKEARSPGPDL
jgi:hypothetical protein